MAEDERISDVPPTQVGTEADEAGPPPPRIAVLLLVAAPFLVASVVLWLIRLLG